MRHLSEEILARLVDERPTEAQEEHLATCDRCTRILNELREQTDVLGSLPALRPPPGDWEEIEARLLHRGLVESGSGAGSGAGSEVEPASAAGSDAGSAWRGKSGDGGRGAPYPGSTWLQVAAALVLFLGGTAFGSWIGPASSNETGAAENGNPASAVTTGATAEETGDLADAIGSGAAGATTSRATSVDEAALELQAAEERYVDALVSYRQTLRSSRGTGSRSGVAESPAARVAALETLVAASQEAIRHAPADPFFNGVLASTMAERQAAIRQISTSSSDDSWF